MVAGQQGAHGVSLTAGVHDDDDDDDVSKGFCVPTHVGPGYNLEC
jgi:hypothetical protein